MSPVLATVLITGGLATAGAISAYDQRSDRDLASLLRDEQPRRVASNSYYSVDDVDENRPSVVVDAGSAGQAAFSMSSRQRRDDEDSDGDSDSDSDRRRGKLGRDRRDRDAGVFGRDRSRDNGRARSRDNGVGAVAYDYGFNDGYDRGLQDGRDRNNHDPVRHGDYRSADRGYDGRLGSRAQYRVVYRDGFRDGYDRGYRDGQDSSRNRGRIRLPWPF